MLIYICLFYLINGQNVNYTYNTNDGYNLACQMRDSFIEADRLELERFNWLNDNNDLRTNKINSNVDKVYNGVYGIDDEIQKVNRNINEAHNDSTAMIFLFSIIIIILNICFCIFITTSIISFNISIIVITRKIKRKLIN